MSRVSFLSKAFVSGGVTIAASVALMSSALISCSGSSNYNCPQGQFYDQNTGQCMMGMGGGQCPAGTMMGPQGCQPMGGGVQCAPGQVFNGQGCVAQQGGQCPPGQQWNGQTCAPAFGGGMLGATSCTPAQPLDANGAAMVNQTLPPFGMQQAGPGARPVGNALSGNFQPGQCLEMQVTLNPGKCYTAVGLGSAGEEVDLQLVPGIPSPVPVPPLATDQGTGPTAIMGGGNNCVKWAAPVPGPFKFVLRVTSGQGMAAAQLYER